MSKESEGNPQNTPTEKERLECEKLRAEIEVIRKPHKSTGFYTAVSTVAIAAITAFWSWSSGWFDVQRMRVSNEKSLVEAQTERLKTERTLLEAQERAQRAHLNELEADVQRLKVEQSSLTNQIVNLEREREEMRSARDYFESEANRLAGADTNAVNLVKKIRELQTSTVELARLCDAKDLLLLKSMEMISQIPTASYKDTSFYSKFMEYNFALGGHFKAYPPSLSLQYPNKKINSDFKSFSERLSQAAEQMSVTNLAAH